MAENIIVNVSGLLRTLNVNSETILDIGCELYSNSDGVKSYFKYIGVSENDSGTYQHHFGCVKEDVDFLNAINADNNFSAVIISSLQNYSTPDSLINSVHDFTRPLGIPVIFVVGNIAHKDIVFKLIEGKSNFTENELLRFQNKRFYNEKNLKKLLCDNGFYELQKNDVITKSTAPNFSDDSGLNTSKAWSHQYIEWFKNCVDSNSEVSYFVRAYSPVDKPLTDIKAAEKRPFLSVLTRTQGKRIQELSETILCLTGQTDIDFELLIVGHKLDEYQKTVVKGIIDSQPLWLREKIRLIEVGNGNRATPLNVGFSEAHGQYISILDDDDIVFDNWVEEFHKLADENPGTILHSYAFAQKWMTVNTLSCTDASRAQSSMYNTHCKKFDLIRQLTINNCPTMSLAFPKYPFEDYGIKFDENLDTTEDWDFLMRTCFVCGVSDSETPTSIYRLWTNAESSQTLHNKKEWAENYKKVRSKFEQAPIVFPVGAYQSLINSNNDLGSLNGARIVNEAMLYIDRGKSYNLTDSALFCESDSPDYKIECTDISEFDNIRAIRFDPTINGGLALKNIKFELTDNLGNKTYYNINDIKTNGIVVHDYVVFLKTDPQISITPKHADKFENIKIGFDVFYNIPNELIDHVTRNTFKKSVIYRFIFKAFNKLRNILGRIKK